MMQKLIPDIVTSDIQGTKTEVEPRILEPFFRETGTGTADTLLL